MTGARPGAFADLHGALEDSIAFSRGELSLVTTSLPARPVELAPASIVELRRSLRMSQAVFAAVINVSLKTVQSWEQGLRHPSHAALRILEMIQEDPSLADRIMMRAPAGEPRLPSAGAATRDRFQTG